MIGVAHDPPVVTLRDGAVALFGYGSLMLRESMERSLGRAYDGPFLDCALDGWRRTWDLAMPNTTIAAEDDEGGFVPARIAYLDIRPEPGTLLVGVLFVVTPDELTAFDRREWIYRRVDVTRDLRGVRLAGGSAFAYVGLPEHAWRGAPTTRELAIRGSYVALVDEAVRRRGPAFREAYERSTDAPPPRLVVRDLAATLPHTTPSFVKTQE